MDTEVLADKVRGVDPLNAEWVTALLFAVFVLLALINVGSPRKWRLLGQAMFRMRLGRQALREEIDLQDRTLLGLVVVAWLVLGLFAWQALQFSSTGALPGFPTLLGVVAAIVVVQALVLQVLSGLLRVDHGIAEHLYTGLLLFILAGLVLLPVVVLLAYRSAWRPGLVVAGTVVVGLMLVYRWVRGAWIGLGEGVPVRYIILYLCAAEILPVLLLLSTLRHPSPAPLHP